MRLVVQDKLSSIQILDIAQGEGGTHGFDVTLHFAGVFIHFYAGPCTLVPD